ncbi:tetratricopeptide repeat protein [Catenulispora pinisilvae]|uniref:tetratricopeptide repeat protein n=1 Tax=Catenulispora pinisilvae TaxID=2705253 RepID=UPI001891BF5F|nr:tetratricopeptide repeat protein [Catenulispora pinisilvae]
MKHVAWRRGRGHGVLRAAVVLVRALGSLMKTGVFTLLGPAGTVITRLAGALTNTGDALDGKLRRKDALADHLRLSRRGRPVRVRDCHNPVALGVHLAADDTGSAPPFVERDATPGIRADVRKGTGFVLVVGESTAGKTRAAYEAVRDLLPGYKLVFPVNRQSLAALIPEICHNRGVVVWLDDLDLYLGSGGLNVGMVQRMIDDPRRRIIIVATMSSNAHARFSARHAAVEGDLIHDVVCSGRDVVHLAREHRLDRIWSPGEIARAHALIADARIAAAVKHAHAGRRGVAEYLAAAPELLSAWRDAWGPESHPRGAALVAAAIDARRAGYHQPLPLVLLRDLHEVYLARRGGQALRPEPWAEALDWATKPLHATSSLLLPRDGDTYLSFDYLHDSVEAENLPPRIPEETWRMLIEHVDAAGAFNLGVTAFARDDFVHAMRALERAVNGNESDPKARRSYARCVCEAGDPQRAVPLFAALFEESVRIHGPDAPQTLADRTVYARCLGMAGRVELSVRLLEEVIADNTRVLGADHELTMRSRSTHAFFVGQAGDPRRAIGLYEALLAEWLQRFDADHPHILSVRFGLAYFTGEAGRPARAASLFEQLVADRTRLQGPYKRYTLNNRRHHAHFLGESGRAAEAAALFESLITDCLAVLDPGHPDTLASRHGRARFVGEAGDPQGAALLMAELMHDESYLRTYAPDSPITLLHRRYYADFICEAGDPRRAAALLRSLVTDTRRILGPRHPALLAAKSSMIRAIGMSGRYCQAVAAYRKLIADCTKWLDPDHPLTLGSRNGHARFLGHVGDPVQAAALFEIIVLDRTRVLGHTHPHTFNSRNGHANFVGRAGDPARATRLLETILAERLRLFGADHPWTRLTRTELDRFRTGGRPDPMTKE